MLLTASEESSPLQGKQELIDDLTLFHHIDRYMQDNPLRRAVAAAVAAFAAASIEISELIGRGPLAGIVGQAVGGLNADGDTQNDLDIRADEIIRAALKSVPYAALVSEEANMPETGDSSAAIAIAYDPFDGSSNIDTNMPVGTIFSILPSYSESPPFSSRGK
jgi:fructose-1,6-bisphosphatase I